MEFISIFLPIFIAFFSLIFAFRIVRFFVYSFYFCSPQKNESPKINDECYKVVYRSKPIQNIRLELVSKK